MPSITLPQYTHQQPAVGQLGNPSQMQQVATQETAIALGYAAALGNLVGSLQAPVINPNFPTIATAPVPITAPLPVLQKVTWLTPTDPGAFNGTLVTSDLTPPPFTAIPPVLSFGTLPTPSFGNTPDSPQVDTNFTLPTLSLSLPAPPSLLSVNVVPFNGVTLPTFSATQPVLNAVAPNVTPYTEGAKYTSTLLTMVYTDLQRALTDGTWTGLSAAAETALWDRAREREYRQAADATAELDRMEAFGFAFPPGVWLDARLKVATELANNVAGASREIAIKQAEMQLENITKLREGAIQLESEQIKYANEIAQRAFEAAKYQTQAQVEIYNSLVQAYAAQQEGYKAAAMVYDYQIKGALAVAEVYRTQIEAEKVKAEINHEIVAMYAELLKGQELNVEIYKAQLGGIETQANIQKLKVEVFGEQIRAYVGQVSAYTAQVEGYKANAEAQVAVESAYKTQVEAYKVQVDAGIAQINSRVETYKANIGAYEARLEAYKAALQAMTEQARAAALYNSSQTDFYRAEIAGFSSYNDNLTKQWQAVIEIAEKQAEVGVKAAEAQGQLYVATKHLASEALKTGGTIAAQLGAAALNAIHFTTSASWSSAGTQSYAASASESDSTSTNENTNHNESV